MAFNMHNRNLLSLMHHSTRELRYLLDLSRDLKRAKYTGTEQQHLKRKNIALIFEKTSTRTRCAFEVAAYDQGANVTYIDPNSSQIGHKESMKDTARVLGRMYDAIEYRGFKQEIVEELAKFAGVPQQRDQGRQADRRAVSEPGQRHRGDRGRLRVALQHRLRAGREPHAYHQGDPRLDPRRHLTALLRPGPRGRAQPPSGGNRYAYRRRIGR